jgi:RHS repeat-associated protein
MDGRFHYVTKLRQLSLLAVLLVSCLVPTTTALARCYKPVANAARLEEQLKEEQALTAKTAYTGIFDPGPEVQIGLLRWYDPNLQRWINRDPIGEAGGINLYRFNYNSPINYVDPDGFAPQLISLTYNPGTGLGTGNYGPDFANVRPGYLLPPDFDFADLWRRLNPPTPPGQINAVFSFGPLDPYLSLGGPSAAAKSANAYEALFECPIAGMSRAAHRASANRSLANQLANDPDLAKMLNQSLGADVLNHMKSGKGALLNPPGAVWHHPFNNPNAIQLLTKPEHIAPALQPILHPGGIGGFGNFYGP